MTNSNMSFKIFFYSFYSPHYLKDNFGQTFECIPRKRCKSQFIPHPKPTYLSTTLSHLLTCIRGSLFQHGWYSRYVGSVKVIWKPSAWETETALLLVQCIICLLGWVSAVVLQNGVLEEPSGFCSVDVDGTPWKRSCSACLSFLFLFFFKVTSLLPWYNCVYRKLQWHNVVTIDPFFPFVL